jgi:hypothetical protein
LEKGSSVFRCGNRSRKLPATMRWPRSLTSATRLWARAVNEKPTATQRSTRKQTQRKRLTNDACDLFDFGHLVQ